MNSSIKKQIIPVLFLFLQSLICVAKPNTEVYDSPGICITEFFSMQNVTYVIQNNHSFSDSITIPKGCELIFRGGALKGRIHFCDTKLSGDVNIKGSIISGKISNEYMIASWLCAMDGTTDDAPSINSMIEVCGRIYFPKGAYRLISHYNPTDRLPHKFHRSIKAHIGICKSNVTLIGETGARFVTSDSLGTICLFSQPNDISANIKKIQIKNLTFEVRNNGLDFYAYMHTIKVIGVNGLEIENCFFNDFWGDAVCLSHFGDGPKTGERTRNRNVRILNNTIIGGDHHNNRNGISIISGENVLVKGNTIRNTSKKNMPGGVDVEPNNSAFTINNIIIENNEFEGVRGFGGAISLVVFKGASAHHVTIKSNIIRKCSIGISVLVKTERTSDNIIIRDNIIDKFTSPYKFKGSGKSKDWIISGNRFERGCIQEIPGEIEVENLVIENNKKKV